MNEPLRPDVSSNIQQIIQRLTSVNRDAVQEYKKDAAIRVLEEALSALRG